MCEPNECAGLVRFTIPWQYIVPDNGAKRGVNKGRIFNSPRYSNALSAAQHLAFFAAHTQEPHAAPFDSHVHVELKFYVPDKRKRDLTNTFKIIMDSMTGSVVTDDTLFKNGSWSFHGIDRENPRVEIAVCLP